MYYVYIIKSLNKNYFYTGLTKNIEDRLLRHTKGREKTTRYYARFRLIHVEVVKDRKEARKMEKYFKSGFGREIIKEIAGVAELADA